MNLQLRLSNYINRYAPSEKKLREYLGRKNHTLNISHTLSEIGYSEGLMCDLWIRSFLASYKGEKEIREKLLKKGFPKTLVDDKISLSLSEIQNWDNYKREIEGKIDSFLLKGKSKKIIEMLLIGKYSFFRDEIKELILSKKDDAGLGKEVGRYLLKYDISNFKERGKFFAALQRKGFDYKNIASYLEKIHEENSI